MTDIVELLLTAAAHLRSTSGVDGYRVVARLEAAAAEVESAEPVELDCYDAGILGGTDLDPAGYWHDYIRAELAAAHDFYQAQADNLVHPPSAPEGYVLVPVEPLGGMLLAGAGVHVPKSMEDYPPHKMNYVGRVYKAMLTAAPQQGGGA